MGNNYGRYGLLLLAGAAIGIAGVALLSRGRLRPLCVKAINRGLELKELATEAVETARERMDDMVAEAKYQKEQEDKEHETALNEKPSV